MADQSSRAFRVTLGIVLAAAGIASMASGAADAWDGMPFSDDRWLKLPLGVMLASLGTYLVLPDSALRSRALLAALVVSGLALCFDWVAFGPGERRFTGGASAGGAAVHTSVNSGVGRFVFGVGALLMDAGAAWYWVVALRVAGSRRPDG